MKQCKRKRGRGVSFFSCGHEKYKGDGTYTTPLYMTPIGLTAAVLQQVEWRIWETNETFLGFQMDELYYLHSWKEDTYMFTKIQLSQKIVHYNMIYMLYEIDIVRFIIERSFRCYIFL
jgi:hypothetical protein